MAVGNEKHNKSIQEDYKIWIIVAAVYSCAVQFRLYEGAKKGKTFSFSTKWGLGENFVVQLMKYLTTTASVDKFMDNFFTSFCLPPHLGFSNIGATDVLNKNKPQKFTDIRDKQLQKIS